MVNNRCLYNNNAMVFLCFSLGAGECSMHYIMPSFTETVMILSIVIFLSVIFLLLTKGKVVYLLTILFLVSLIASSFFWIIPERFQEEWPDRFTYPSRLFVENPLGFYKILVIISALGLILSDYKVFFKKPEKTT